VLAELLMRDSNAQDEAFLRQLYASTRDAELALLDWDQATRRWFVDMQFDARERYHAQHFPQARCQLIEVDGRPVGRLQVQRDADEWRILDIALLPSHRGQRLGTRSLQALLDEADALGLPLALHVEISNPARHWYERLGFKPLSSESTGPYLAMSRPSQGQQP